MLTSQKQTSMRNRRNYFSLLLNLLVFETAIDISRCEMNLTLANGYDENEPPNNATGGPLTVQFNFKDKIRVNEVNVKQLTIHLHMVVFIKWFDDRLKTSGQQGKNEVSTCIFFFFVLVQHFWYFFQKKNIPMDQLDIWIPQFKVKETIPDWYSKQNLNYYINYNTKEQLIEMRQTVSVHLLCSEMNFSLFPFDSQNCRVYFQNKRTNKLAFEFGYTNIEVASNNDFIITANVNQHSNISTKIGFDLTMKRKSGLYLVTWYMPSAMFVIISWSR